MANPEIDSLFLDSPSSLKVEGLGVSDDEFYEALMAERLGSSYGVQVDDYEASAESMGYNPNPVAAADSVTKALKERHKARQLARQKFDSTSRERLRKSLVEGTKDIPYLGTATKIWSHISRASDIIAANVSDAAIMAASGLAEQVAASGTVGTGAPGPIRKPGDPTAAEEAAELVAPLKELREGLSAELTDPDMASTVVGQTLAVASQIGAGVAAMTFNPTAGIAMFEGIAFNEAVEAYDTYAPNPNPEDRMKFGVSVALPSAALDMVGGEATLAKLLSKNGSLRKQVLMRLASSMPKEGLTEVAQSEILRIMLNTKLDAEREFVLDEKIAEFLVGMAGAGVVGGAVAVPALKNARISEVLDSENVSTESIRAMQKTVSEQEFVDGTQDNAAQEALMRAMYRGDPGARQAYLQIVEEQRAAPTKPPSQVEAIGLTKQESQTIKEDLDLSDATPQERIQFRQTLQEVKAESLEAGADALAAEVVSSPRMLTPKEQTSLTLRAAQLKNQYKLQIEKASKFAESGKPEEAFAANEKARNTLRLLETVAQASDVAGTAIGQAFVARKIRVKLDDYSFAGLVSQAQANKGSALTDAEQSFFQNISREIEDARARIAELEHELNQMADELVPQSVKDALMEARIVEQQKTRKARQEVDLLRKRGIMERSLDALALPRTLLATGDMSATLRQGLLLSVRRPITASKIFAKSFKEFFSQHTADQIDLAIKLAPEQKLREKAKLYLTPMDRIDLAAREEQFASTIAEKIPGFGKVVLASERHMVATLNMLRAAAFDQYASKYPDASISDLRAFADYINKASGRGNLGKAAAAAQGASFVFFAPRFAISRFQAPFTLVQNWKNKPVRNEIAKDFAAFTSVGGTILMLAALAGLDVGTDPEDSDFGKIIYGNTRIDIWGSFLQPARLVMQPVMAGVQRFDKGKTDIDILSAGMDFTKYKLSPAVTLPAQLLTGKDVVGQDRTLVETTLDAAVPLTVQEAVDTWVEEDNAIMAGGAFAGAFMGVGISSFDK